MQNKVGEKDSETETIKRWKAFMVKMTAVRRENSSVALSLYQALVNHCSCINPFNPHSNPIK